jgi:hypothetical protein
MVLSEINQVIDEDVCVLILQQPNTVGIGQVRPAHNQHFKTIQTCVVSPAGTSFSEPDDSASGVDQPPYHTWRHNDAINRTGRDALFE